MTEVIPESFIQVLIKKVLRLETVRVLSIYLFSLKRRTQRRRWRSTHGANGSGKETSCRFGQGGEGPIHPFCIPDIYQ